MFLYEELINWPVMLLSASQNYANVNSGNSVSTHSAHFYLGSSSGDGTCDQVLTEFELNSKPLSCSYARVLGGSEYIYILFN